MEFSKQFTKEDIQVADKYITRALINIVLEKHQLKQGETPYTSKWLNEIEAIPSTDNDMKQQELLHTADGMANLFTSQTL